jgi:hypothetical protein
MKTLLMFSIYNGIGLANREVITQVLEAKVVLWEPVYTFLPWLTVELMTR